MVGMPLSFEFLGHHSDIDSSSIIKTVIISALLLSLYD